MKALERAVMVSSEVEWTPNPADPMERKYPVPGSDLMANPFPKPKKKKKGKKKKKKGKKKGLKLPGAKMIKDLSVNEVLVQLINHRIVKKIPAQNLTDFIGEFNYIHLMLDDIKETPYDPSMALIRQLVTEYIIFPLGSALVRK